MFFISLKSNVAEITLRMIHHKVETVGLFFVRLYFEKIPISTKFGPQLQKLPWVRVLTRKVYARPKLSKHEERRQGRFVRFGEDCRNQGHKHQKTVLGSSVGKDFGFRDNFFVNIHSMHKLSDGTRLWQTDAKRHDA